MWFYLSWACNSREICILHKRVTSSTFYYSSMVYGNNLEIPLNYKFAPGTFDHCWKILVIFKFVDAIVPLLLMISWTKVRSFNG